jgi:hypothetical protein
VNNVAETIAAAEQSFADPAFKSGDRVAVANEMFYKPGTATDRAVKELYELMEIEPA